MSETTICRATTKAASLAAMLLSLLLLLPACGGPKTNGDLCASCSTPDDKACESSTIINDQDIGFFCGDTSRDACRPFCALDSDDLNENGVTTEFVCTTNLVCAHQVDRASRRCYPTLADGKTPHPDFPCGGDKPDPAG